MYSLTAVAFFLVAIVHLSAAYYYGNSMELNNRAPMCATANKPCRFRVMLGHLNGALGETNAAGTCTCPRPYQCSTDWDTPGHVISRKVTSGNFNITLQMMFCQEVIPLAFCRRGRISVELKGPSNMPMEISAYNCRCRRRQTLVLKERRFGDDYLTYHSYACSNHMRTCVGSERCVNMTDTIARYPCQCPSGLACRTTSREGSHCTTPDTY